MQVPDNKDIANRVVPESCVSHREVRREALAGVRIGQQLSRDRKLIPDADVVSAAEGNMFAHAIASAQTIRRGRRTWHVRTLLAREPGDLQSDRRRQYRPTARIGKARSRSR